MPALMCLAWGSKSGVKEAPGGEKWSQNGNPKGQKGAPGSQDEDEDERKARHIILQASMPHHPDKTGGRGSESSYAVG